MADVSSTTEPAEPVTAEADLADEIGRRLAAHRRRRGVRVADLAREVGVTPGLISQIERGQSRPSVSTLFALAQALEVPVDAFFREPEGGGGPEPSPASAVAAGSGRAPDRYLVRRGNRAVIDIEGGVRWERLTPKTLDHLDFMELVYAPGAESNPAPYTHPGTEMVLVLSGTMEISVGFEVYRLEPGDSMEFPCSMPHRYVNPGAQTTRAVTVILYDCPPGAGQAAPEDRPHLA